MIDMIQICRRIDIQVPEGFEVQNIRINLEYVTPDIREEEWPEIIDQFQRIASNELQSDLTVTQDSNLTELWDFDIAHSNCGTEPMYDASSEEYYCVVCNDSIWDY